MEVLGLNGTPYPAFGMPGLDINRYVQSTRTSRLEIKKPGYKITRLFLKAPLQGLEPWTYGLTVRRSNQLS